MRALATAGTKLKALATTTTASTSQYGRSPQDGESGRSSLATTFSNVRRRATESLLQSTGKVKAAAEGDHEYEARRARLTEVEGHIGALTKGAPPRAFIAPSSSSL